jgi:type IV secretion system protein TrbL
MDTLTTIMNVFKAGFESGITNITPAAQGLYLSLLTIDFIWAMCKAAMDPGANYIKILVEKSVRYAIFGFFITNYDKVFHQVIDSLIQVGLKAGGSTLTAANFADPSWILAKAWTTVEPIEKFITDKDSFVLNMIGSIILLALVYAGIVIAFSIMAIQVFITYLEVYIVGTLAVIFLGCGVNKHTSFLAEKAIGSVLSFGIKLMTLAFILSIATPILNGIVTPAAANIPTYLKLLVGVAAIAFLCWQSPSLAAGLMAGSPSLTAGGVAGAMMAAGSAVSALAGAATMAGKALGGLSGGAGGAGGAMSATMEAANAFSGSSDAGNTSNLLNTSLGDSSSGLGGSPSGGGGSGMTAANVAGKVDPSASQRGGSTGALSDSGSGLGGSGTSSNPTRQAFSAGSSPSAGGDERGNTTGSATSSGNSSFSSEGQGGTSSGNSSSSSEGQGGAFESTVPASEGSGSETSSSTGSNDGISSGNVSDSNASAPTSSEGESTRSSSGIKAADVLSRVQNAIPPESSPQGGVGVTLHHDD